MLIKEKNTLYSSRKGFGLAVSLQFMIYKLPVTNTATWLLLSVNTEQVNKKGITRLGVSFDYERMGNIPIPNEKSQPVR